MKSRSFIRDISIYGIGGVLTRFVGLVTTPIYTRLLNADGFGLLELVNSIAAILIILVSMEMHSGYGRSYFECISRGDLLKLRGSIMLYYVSIYALLIVIFSLLYVPLGNWISIIKMELIIPVVLNILPALIIGMTLVTIRYEERPVLYSIITLTNVGFTALGGIIAVTYYDLGVYGIIWSNTIISWLVCVSLFIFIPNYTRFSISIKYFKETFYYSAPITPAVLGNWINQNMGRIFIASAFSLSMVGIYSIALKLGLIMSLTTNAFKLAWTPKANKYFGEVGSEPKFALVLDYYLLVYTVIIVGLVALSPIIVNILAPESFYEAVAYAGLIVVAQMWDGVTNIVAAGNNWERKTYYNSLGSILGSIVAVLILYIWISEGGILIASIALLIGSLTKTGIILLTAQKNHYIPYSLNSLFFSVTATTAFAFFAYFCFTNLNLLWGQSLLIFLIIGGVLIVLTDIFVTNGKGKQKASNLISSYLVNKKG